MISKRAVGLLLLVLFISGCGPATFTQRRIVFEGVSSADNRQEKDGVVAELKYEKDVPASFFARVQACNAAGILMIDAFKNPVIETVRLSHPGQYWQQVALTNNTDHVLRMNSVVIRLFDPAGTQIEPLNWSDLQSALTVQRPCVTTAQALQLFRVNKIFDRNMEIVPGSVATFWIPFRPPSMAMTGVWRFTIYEVPVLVDSAGRPARTTRFDMRVVAKQFEDTFRRDNPLAPAILLESKEVSAGATSPSRGGAQPVAPQRPAQVRPVEGPSASPQEARTPAPAAATPAAAARPTASAAPAPAFAITKDLIIQAQTRLKALGFDAGVPDGHFGARSKAALSKFQVARRLPVSGELTPDTLNALGVTSNVLIDAPTGASTASQSKPDAPNKEAPAAQPSKGEKPKSLLEL